MASTTDAVWRLSHETFSEIARDYGVWVVTGVDVGDAEEVTDPEVAAIVGDPDRPEEAPVYWLPDVAVYNQAIFYNPAGEMTSRVRKEYLTDMEVGSLALNGGLPERLGPVAVGDLSRATPLISRDAWMQPAIDRMALQGADSILQLEAFAGGWGYGGENVAETGPWTPDNLKRSSWSAVQKHPEIRAAVAPMLVGNFFEVVFDGQSFAVRDGTPGDEPMNLVGQEPDTGWAAIGSWVMEDPEGTLAERRKALNEAAIALAPGGENDNGYRQSTVYVDVDIPANDGHPVVEDLGDTSDAAWGASVALAPSGLGRQRLVDAALDGEGGLVAVWEDARLCASQIFAARSEDGGNTWTEPVRVAPGATAQRSPSLVHHDGTFVVAWQEVLDEGRAEIRVARSPEGLSWSRPTSISPADSLEAWTPDLAVDASSGILHLAYIDRREEDGNWRVYYSRSEDRGKSFAGERRLDPRDRSLASDDLTYTNEWSVSVAAAAGKVAVSYTHRQRPVEDEQPSIDAFVMVSDSTGEEFAQPRALDRGGFPERLSSDIDLAMNDAGQWTVAWSTFRGESAESQVLVSQMADGETFAETPALEPARSRWLPTLVALDDGWAIAWQDFRNGSNDIYAARWSAESGFGEVVRLDDGGSTGAQAWRPRLVADGSTLYAFWEDSRSGHAEIRIVSGVLP
jgi:predicted amidohydrolase